MSSSNDQTALITGASSGLGYEFAKLLGKKGLNLILASRNKEKLIDIKNELEKDYNVLVHVIPVDLSKHSSAKMLFDECEKLNIVVDVVINNAGFGMLTELEFVDEDKVIEMMNVNMVSLTVLCHLFARQMKERKRGYILNVASTAGYTGLPMMLTYATTKSYVIEFTKSLRCVLKDYNIVVLCLAPGLTKTNFFKVSKLKHSSLMNITMMSADTVAKMAINGLFKRKTSIIPGIINKLYVFFVKTIIPKCLFFRIFRMIYNKIS